MRRTVAGKARVHELAKEFGIESKALLQWLKDHGEFVKSASSTVEAPVVRKLKEAFPAAPAAAPAPAKAPAAAAASSPNRSSTATLGAEEAPPAPVRAPQPAKVASPAAPAAASPANVSPGPLPERPAAAAAPPAAGQPTAPPSPGVPPGPPASSAPLAPAAHLAPPAAVPRAPGQRPAGNNPFTSPASTPRPAAPRPAGITPGLPPRPGAPRPGPTGMPPRPGGTAPGMPPRPGAARPGGPSGGMPPRPGSPRPGPGAFPAGPRQGAGSFRPGAPAGRPGAQGARPGAPGARPGAPAGGGAGGYGRPGGGAGRGRGGTAGAFGRPGAPRGKQRKSKRAKRQEFDNLSAPTLESGAPRGDGEVVRLARGASLADFADKINANPSSLVQVALIQLNEMVTATQSVTDELLQLIGVTLGYTVQIVTPGEEDAALLARYDIEFGADYDEDSELEPRPAVVTVMGHVDHGKTRLLDAIRHADVAQGEAGGITQHIGAYQVHNASSDRLITFIDTPGHEAFTAMRARGAKVTDIVVLVVAADDGVKPQTIEALNHAQAADVPIVVAVNKIDKEGADPAKVRGQLTEYGLVAEEYGGQTMFVDVSARNAVGIQELLDAVLLTADAALELTADPHVDAQGVAIEGHLDRGRGPVATVLVQRGTLRVGDSVVAGDAFGRVRAMLDEHGATVTEAGPSRPVQVLGFTSVPGAGDNLVVVPEDRVARQIAEQRQARERNAELAMSRRRPTLESIFDQLKEGQKSELVLILKGDVSGSVEALEDALLKLDVGEEVALRIIHRGVGAITENDVTLASASDAVILAFNVRPEGKARELADRERVDIRYYNVIYAAIEDIESALTGLLKPIYEEAQLGTAEVREVFRVPRIGNVAGVIVRSGTIVRNSKARLIRDGVVVAESLSVESLRRFKDDATEVREGYECGIGLGSFNDIKLEDVIETFELREKPRT